MIESEWLEIVKKVRGNGTWGNFCVEKQQFDTFYGALKEFDVRHIREAADRIIRGYAYPPIVATFTVYIEKVQKDERYSADRQLAEKRQAESAKRKPTGDGGWIRFSLWMLKTKKKWPPTLEEGRKMKDRFLREHPRKEAG